MMKTEVTTSSNVMEYSSESESSPTVKCKEQEKSIVYLRKTFPVMNKRTHSSVHGLCYHDV